MTHISHEGLDDEIQLAGREAFDALLHNMIRVLIHDALQNMPVELKD